MTTYRNHLGTASQIVNDVVLSALPESLHLTKQSQADLVGAIAGKLQAARQQAKEDAARYFASQR